MHDIDQTIHASIREVAEQRGLTLPPLAKEQTLTADLGLKSLDLAHLIALLESRLQADPFSQWVPITSIRTVGDLCGAYSGFLSSQASPVTALQEGEHRAGARRQAETVGRAARQRLRHNHENCHEN